jgi:hypothetical protein
MAGVETADEVGKFGRTPKKTLDDLIAALAKLREEVGGDAAVAIEDRPGSVRYPVLDTARMAAGRGPIRLVSRQGLPCILIK